MNPAVTDGGGRVVLSRESGASCDMLTRAIGSEAQLFCKLELSE